MVRLLTTGLIAQVLWLVPAAALACPFCSAVALTFTEEINNNDVAVIARLIDPPMPPEPGSTKLYRARFECWYALKGANLLDPSGLAQGEEKQGVFHFSRRPVVKVLYFGDKPKGTMFLLFGSEPPKLNWATPIPLSKKAIDYLLKLPTLPPSGAKRLAFFYKYLQCGDSLLERDAYDEFARAPYDDVKALKPYLNRQELLRWIQDPKVAASRKRLYLTMLGICGRAEDAQLLERILLSPTDRPKMGLDAMIACYLTLKGAAGLPLVEKHFLGNPKASYSEVYAAIQALRFHGQSESVIPRKRLARSFHLLLDRPELADLVIPDLARWEDWSVMDRLVELFKQAEGKKSWVRVPVVQYLKACPEPRAKKLLKELERIDPKAVRRASFFFPSRGRPGGGKPPAGSASPSAK